ncbi:hypothetical protein B0H16DRAFT_175400 [Mycena metata]|uniref:Uncharacterized protein n=1 Tax=Mycena metata TaxID=1033252 RepID=A0AAD7MU36_9AGAR|nr:hypothetical protein B0H16DRAFT_175400 [Mycena metata]
MHGQESPVTVAMYHGSSAEEEWRQDIAKYMEVRHPNILQLHGTAIAGNIHAAIFHDDLIPFEQFLDHYRHSPMLTTYILGCSNRDYKAALDSFHPVSQQSLGYGTLTFWIRRSTGRLCVELIRPFKWIYLDGTEYGHIQEIDLGSAPNIEAKVANSLTLGDYHKICGSNLVQY